MTQAVSPTAVAPGTRMVKVIPPRMVEPYLNGQRTVIAGYLYRVQDCALQSPADYHRALGLGYEGSDFTPDAPELFVLRWLALDMSGSLRTPPLSPRGPAATVPEFYTLPVPIPVGAEIYRITAEQEEFIARYDGQVWLRPMRRS